MDSDKSIAIWLIENVVILLFVLLFIVDFFEIFFKINLVKIILTDGIIYEWQKLVPLVTLGPTAAPTAAPVVTTKTTSAATTNKSAFSTLNDSKIRETFRQYKDNNDLESIIKKNSFSKYM